MCAFWAPEKWRDKSQVAWDYANTGNPAAYSASAENPANDNAYFGYPPLEFFSLRPDGNLYRPGQKYWGKFFAHQPQPAATPLLAFVQQVRGACTKFHVIGSKDLPDLPKAFKLAATDNHHGVGVKVAYELDGRPVEEEFYAVYYSGNIPYDGPQGRGWQINWGLGCLHSFRAPSGTLERRRSLFAAIAKSFRPNPAWNRRVAATASYLTEQFNRQLQAGYDTIAAAKRLSIQVSANNDAMIASIDQKLAASRAAGQVAAGSAGRSANDNFDNYIRGVDTVNDPLWGTSQHSFAEKYHWTDGYGNYRNANDPTYDPNRHENGGWQLMQPAH